MSFLFWNGDILTLQIHFFSFCEHLVASAASCTAWMIMLVTCLKQKQKRNMGDKCIALLSEHSLFPDWPLPFFFQFTCFDTTLPSWCDNSTENLSSATLLQPWGLSWPQQRPAGTVWEKVCRRKHKNSPSPALLPIQAISVFLARNYIIRYLFSTIWQISFKIFLYLTVQGNECHPAVNLCKPAASSFCQATHLFSIAALLWKDFANEWVFNLPFLSLAFFPILLIWVLVKRAF